MRRRAGRGRGLCCAAGAQEAVRAPAAQQPPPRQRRSSDRALMTVPRASVRTVRIVGVERRATRTDALLHERDTIDGSTSSVARVAGDEAADHGAAERRGRLAPLRRARAPSASCRRSSRRSSSAPAACGARAASIAASQRRCRRGARACSANVTSRIAFATATPMAMIAPMNDCTFSVVRVTREHQRRRRPAPPAPSRRRRTRAAATGSWRPAAGRSRRPPRRRPAAMFASVSRIGAIWPRTVTVAPRGGVAGARDRLVDARRRRGRGPRRRRWPTASPSAGR